MPIGKALLIPCVMGLTLGCVFYAYERRPYGNMSILPAVKQNMDAVQIVMNQKLSDQTSQAFIYKNRYAEDRSYVEKIKSELAQLESLSFSSAEQREDENLGYMGTDTHGTSFRMIFFFRSGEWNYTTFPEKIAKLTKGTAKE